MCPARFSAAVLSVGLAALIPAVPRAGAGEPRAPAVFHVAAGGDDRNAGSAEKPFATLERARDAVRALKRDQDGRLRQPVTALVHSGTHVLAAPLVLTPEDSGTA